MCVIRCSREGFALSGDNILVLGSLDSKHTSQMLISSILVSTESV